MAPESTEYIEGQGFTDDYISFSEAVDALEQQIDQNFNALGNFVDQLKMTAPDEQANWSIEFNQAVAYYDQALSYARSIGEQGTIEEQESCLNELKTVLDWSSQLLESIGAQLPQYEDPSIMTGETAMIGPAEAAAAQGAETIQMHKEGTISQFWNSLNPQVKTLAKIGAIAGAIFLGNKVYQTWKKISSSTNDSDPEAEPEPEEEETGLEELLTEGE